jgi:hypothetical protein
VTARAGSPTVRRTAAILRAAAAIAVLVAVIATVATTLGAGPFFPTRFFGYFTIQGNLICFAVYALAAVAGFTGLDQGAVLTFLRGAATTYIVIVGVVYNTLLTDVNVGVLVPWANAVLHIVVPIYAALDWLVFRDRQPLPWRRLPLVLFYPLLWTAATLLRGAVERPDPFFPYPFLNPANFPTGYQAVGLFVLGIAVAFLVVGALVWSVSRRLRPR